MSFENNPNYVRTPLYNNGTKTINTESGIEYCVEYINEDNKKFANGSLYEMIDTSNK